VTTAHVFQERTQVAQALHLNYWYGNVRMEHEDPELDLDNPVVCWCGGRRYTLDRSHSVVWHVGAWDGVAELLDGDVD
jgi:hypothetical protein